MKRLLFICISLVHTIAFAQQKEYLDISNIKALIQSDGLLFRDTTNHTSAFEVPKGDTTFTIAASSFWMSSQSSKNGYPHYTVSYKRYGDAKHFKAGPVDIINQRADTSTLFNRVWKIDKTTIDNHIQQWNDPTYLTPSSILDWPGNGNSTNAKILAPFADLDNDSIYEPNNGEYPLIKGEQAVYVIFNDFDAKVDSLYNIRPKIDSSGNLVIDTIGNAYATAGKNLVEVHLMLYAYNHNSIEIRNTVFVNVKIFNRTINSNGNLNDFKFSVYTDFDSGQPNDDFVATDTLRDLIYVYNADNFDQSSPGIKGFHSNLAVQGLKLLDRDIQSSFSIPNPSAQGFQFQDYYVNFYQRNQFYNGRLLYYGGDGYGLCTDSNRLAQYHFTGNPLNHSNPKEWTEIDLCPNDSGLTQYPGDRQMICTPALPIQLNHGEMVEFNYAYIFSQDSGGVFSSITTFLATADSVQAFYDRNSTTNIQPISSEQINFNLYPNPAKGIVKITTKEKRYTVELFSLNGVCLLKEQDTDHLNLNSLKSGIYLIRVSTEKGFSYRKLIKI